jgi:hypothetical protein
MTTSTTKLMIALAIATSMLTAASAMAKGGNSGGHSFSHASGSGSVSSISSSKFTGTTFKLNTQSSGTTSFKNGTTIATNQLNGTITTVNPTKNGNPGTGKTINKPTGAPVQVTGINTIGPSKGNGTITVTDPPPTKGCNHDCSKFWCGSYCGSYCFGGYCPIYDCYDYCTPTYTTCSYTVAPIVEVAQPVPPARTSVPVGSILTINGQLGDKAGGARLQINGLAMPIEVLEWTPAGVKVRLPQLEIAGVTPAEIEVIRGDGSVAAKSPIDLAGMPGQVAINR